MKIRISANALNVFAALLIAMMLLQPAQVSAQEPPPEPQPIPVLFPEVASPEDARQLQAYQAGRDPFSLAASQDFFGYSMYSTISGDPEVSFSWIDAAGMVGQDGCRKTGLSGSDAATLIPFSAGRRFKFYEKEFTSLYASTEGYLSFSDPSAIFENTPLPLPAVPNNLVSVFWDDISIDQAARPNSGLYVCETAQYIVLQWHQVVIYKSQGQGSATFEAILYWNTGDIKVQFQSFDGDIANATTGIEDGIGRDGLTYQFNNNELVQNNAAVLFKRPPQSARVNAWPDYQGKFPIYNDSKTYDHVTFPVHIVNTGDLSSQTFDTYTVEITGDAPGWLLHTENLDPDGSKKKIRVPQGESAEFKIHVYAPSSAEIGDYINITVRLTSQSDLTKSKAVILEVAIPAPFVQSYWDNDGDRLVFTMIERARIDDVDVKVNVQNTGGLAVVRRPIGYAYLWDEKRLIAGKQVEVSEINYALLDLKGVAPGGIKKMTHHGNPDEYILDTNAAVAVAPNGRIGVLWLRQTGPNPESLANNLYFAVLNNDGQMVGSPVPVPLTTNVTPNYPSYREMQITATTDSHFVLSWREQTSNSLGLSNNIVYSVTDSDGKMLMSPLPYRTGAAGSSDLFFAPAITGLKDGRFIMAWGRKLLDEGNPDGGYYLTEFSVFTSWGQPLMNPQSVSGLENGAGRADITELFDGRVVLAIPYGDIQTVVLKYNPSVGTYQQETLPVSVSHPSCVTFDNRYVSLTPTLDNQAVLTWICYSYGADTNKDGISPYQYELYYALIGSNGRQVTDSQIFYTSNDTSTPLLQVNQFGYHNSTHPRLKVGVVDYVLSVPEILQVDPGLSVEAPAFYMNIGKMNGTGAQFVATLDPRLEIIEMTPQPDEKIGNILKWNIPAMGFLDSGSVNLNLRSAHEGDHHINWQIVAGIDDDPGDNQGRTVLRFQLPTTYKGAKVMLPAVMR